MKFRGRELAAPHVILWKVIGFAIFQVGRCIATIGFFMAWGKSAAIYFWNDLAD